MSYFAKLKLRTGICVLAAVALSLLAITVTAVPAGETKKAEKELKPTRAMSAITSVSVAFIARQHYSQKPLNMQLSQVIFDNYMKTLDPSKIYFMQADIDGFSRYRNKLHELLPAGRIDFAFEAFNLYLQRIKEYQAYAEVQISKGVNLDTNEEFMLDRSKSAWAKDREELQSLWGKRLKNDLINLKLADMLQAEEQKKQEQNAADGKKPEKTHESWQPKSPEERLKKRLNQITHNYTEMEAISVLELFLSSVMQAYDPHSAYMSPSTEQSFDISMKLSLCGIGAVLTTDDGYTKVVEVVPGGPAEKEGQLKTEDRIIAVKQENADPVDVIDLPLNKVVDMIRGPVDTKVTLTVLDGAKGLHSMPKTITIVRNKIVLKESEAKSQIREVKQAGGKSRKVGVISLPSFYMDFDAARRGDPNFKSSTRDVDNLLKEFEKEKVDGVVIDLRSNGGGSLWEAIMLTGLFIKSGPVVQVRDILNTAIKEDEDDGYIAYTGPLIVMINRMSASASEIFAAAIKDYRRGLIVGDSKTHGKGSVQTVNELDRYMPFYMGERFPAGSVKLTNAKFYRINGESTQIKGVTPDISFPSFTDMMELGEERLDYALPWDTVKPAVYNIFDAKLQRLIPDLKKKSEARIHDSVQFQVLKLDIDTFNKIREKKTVSLNLQTRWQEYLAGKKIQDEQTKLLHLDEGNGVSKGKKDGEKEKINDLYLEETLNIMSDLIGAETSVARR